MRTLNYESVKKIKKDTDSLVVKVVEAYNSKEPNKNEFAVRGGTRRKRDDDEARVLARFSLK